jgi:hypothetical protein
MNKNMKTKTIFKGIINGKEFNNVNEYNAVLTDLMAKGVAINASTSTSTKMIDESHEPNINMLPGFGVMASNKKAYVNNYVTGDKKTDKENLDNLTKYLHENIESVARKILDMDAAALQEYSNDIDNILNIISIDTKQTVDTIAKKKKELDVLENALKVLELWKYNYEAFDDLVEDAATKFEEKCEYECKCQDNENECGCNNVECKCEHCKEEELNTDLEKLLNSEKFTEVINNITKLLGGWR